MLLDEPPHPGVEVGEFALLERTPEHEHGWTVLNFLTTEVVLGGDVCLPALLCLSR